MLARSLSDTFAGMAPSDVPWFVAAEIIGAAAAVALCLVALPSARVATSSRSRGGMKQPVLFVCIHNSARSQMAEAFLNERCSERFAAESAGLEPGTLNPLAIAAMAEVGVDISAQPTRDVFDLFKAGRRYAYVITVCDESSGERCPIFPGHSTRLHWSFPDPSALEGSQEERLSKTRAIRDQIRARIEEWCDEVCGATAAL